MRTEFYPGTETTYRAHWVHLDESIHVDIEGDVVVHSDEPGDTRTSEGARYVEACALIRSETGYPVIVTRLVAVA